MTLHVVTTPLDHEIARLPGQERNAELSYLIVTRSGAGASWDLQNDDDVASINATAKDAGADVSLAPGGFTVAEQSHAKNSAHKPSSDAAKLPRAAVVSTPVDGGETTHDIRADVLHFAKVHMAVSALRQEISLATLEEALRSIRAASQRRDNRADKYTWASLLQEDALKNLAEIGSALSTFRAELWFESTPGSGHDADAVRRTLKRTQKDRDLSARLRNVDSTTQAWASALNISRSVDQAAESEKAEAARDRLEHMLAAVAVVGLALTSGSLWHDAKDEPWTWALVGLVILILGGIAWRLVPGASTRPGTVGRKKKAGTESMLPNARTSPDGTTVSHTHSLPQGPVAQRSGWAKRAGHEPQRTGSSRAR